MSNFFALFLQYFGKVFLCGFIALCLHCFCFILSAFICMLCTFKTYSTSYCCHYKLKDPWYLCMYIYMYLNTFNTICHSNHRSICMIYQTRISDSLATECIRLTVRKTQCGTDYVQVAQPEVHKTTLYSILNAGCIKVNNLPGANMYQIFRRQQWKPNEHSWLCVKECKILTSISNANYKKFPQHISNCSCNSVRMSTGCTL